MVYDCTRLLTLLYAGRVFHRLGGGVHHVDKGKVEGALYMSTVKLGVWLGGSAVKTTG